MRILDLFCGAGGSAMGLHRAMPDAEIIGVDIKLQSHYQFQFVNADAMTFDLSGFDFIWASPPCQGFSALKSCWNNKKHPDLLTPTRERLIANGIPYVIENVEGAPMRHPLTILCGTMFGLRTADGKAELWRHRIFEHNFYVGLVAQCNHRQTRAVIGVYGGHGRDRRRVIPVAGYTGGKRDGTQQFSVQQRREAMGITWMTGTELSQSIPPAYSEFIGQWAMRAIQST